MKGQEDKKANLFLIGNPKSGSTAMHNYLSQHSRISMSMEKEPHYFCIDFHSESDNFHKGRKYFLFRDEKSYHSIFNKEAFDNPDIDWIGESSQSYLYSGSAASGIKKYNPFSRIIITLRNPVDYLYSLHDQYLEQNQENLADLMAAIKLEAERKLGNSIPKGVRTPSYLFYSQRVKYFDQVKRYFDVFPENQIKTVIYEDYKDNNIVILKEIFEFLNLDSPASINLHSSNPAKKTRSKLINGFINNPIIKNTVRSLVSDKRFNKMKPLAKKILYRNKVRDELNLISEAELKKLFYNEVEKISDFLNMDLISKWNFLPNNY